MRPRRKRSWRGTKRSSANGASSTARSPTALRRPERACLPLTRLHLCQWKSARSTNIIEWLHEEFKRRIKTQTVRLSRLEDAGQLAIGWAPPIADCERAAESSAHDAYAYAIGRLIRTLRAWHSQHPMA